MKNTISGRTIFMITFGVLVLFILALAAPTPMRDWFATSSVGGVPATIGAISLLILFTPVLILATVMSKFNVDFADESSGDL